MATPQPWETAMKKNVGLMLAVLALSGCEATYPKAEFSKELGRRNQEIAALRHQYQQEIQDRSLDPIREKVTLSESYLRQTSPCVGRIDDSYPTPGEQAALRQWMSERSDFLTQLASLTTPVPSENERYTRIMTRYDANKFSYAAQITQKLDELAEGHLTYCQFAKASQRINLAAHRNALAFRNELSTEDTLDFKRSAAGGVPLIRLYGNEMAEDK
jgi:hypothetical protein